VLSAAQATPSPRKRTNDAKPYVGVSTASSKRKLNTRQNVALATPTKTYQSLAAKQRQPLNGPHTLTSTVQSKPSPSKSSISNASSRTVIRTQTSNHGLKTKSEKSPVRVTPNKDTTSSTQRQVLSSEIKQKPSTVEGRGRKLIRPAVKENRTKLTQDQRKISAKIEELYRVKSLERNQENLQEFGTSQETPSARARTLPRVNGARQTEFEGGRGRALSRVATMRKRFEGAAPPKPLIPVVPPTLPMLLFSNISPFSKDRKAVSEAAAPPPDPPVFLPPSDSKRSANVSPKTVQEPRTVRKGSKRMILNAPEIQPPLATTWKQPAKGSSTIRDRIKLFENIQQPTKAECENSKSSYARRIRTSMKSLFERKSGEDDGRGLNSQEVKDIINEFQDNELLLPKTVKRNTISGTWKTFAEGAPSHTMDGTMSERGIGSPCTEGVTVMIVKEAECGLKQPRPVRVTEMKRMMLLCRERVGSIIEKEKSRAAQQSRKL
jgi:hypothetical protein